MRSRDWKQLSEYIVQTAICQLKKMLLKVWLAVILHIDSSEETLINMANIESHKKALIFLLLPEQRVVSD